MPLSTSLALILMAGSSIAAPQSFAVSEGRVHQVRADKMRLGRADASGRRAPEVDPGAPAKGTPTVAGTKGALPPRVASSLVQKRWVRFALQLTPEQAEALVERAAAKKLSPVHVQRHDDATDGWALATGGYAA